MLRQSGSLGKLVLIGFVVDKRNSGRQTRDLWDDAKRWRLSMSVSEIVGDMQTYHQMVSDD